jgi:Cu(I)/Ag(I) efflux system membrane protein CusA/SilA
VQYGPAPRRGGLDKGGVEAVGGVVVARYGANPLLTIENLKNKINEIAPGLPQKTLADGTISKVTIVPFYDRSGLIHETLGTLEAALSHEVLISILVVIILVINLRASLIISGLLPIGVLTTFILMKWFHVDANIVALSGIAIAIGVMVDIGIVFTENIIRHLEMPENEGAKGKKLRQIIYEATTEVAPAIITALATTVVSFLPVFAMEAAEGKLFKPLAYTKTFAIIVSFILGIVILPALAHVVFSISFDKKKVKRIFNIILISLGSTFIILYQSWIAIALIGYGINNLLEYKWDEKRKQWPNYINIAITLSVVLYFLSLEWMPLGADKSLFINFIFVAVLVGIILTALSMVVKFYVPILKWALENKWKFMILPFITLFFGLMAYMGFPKIFGFMPDSIKNTESYKTLSETFPGLGKEFMPALDEGSFLLMPTTMPHSGVTENMEIIAKLDQSLNSIPEVASTVGKWGRANTALDPAPISMYENIINYVPEYIVDEDGQRIRFKVNDEEAFILKDGSTYKYGEDKFRIISKEELIEDKDGEYFRQWRPHIKSPDDIWQEIINHSKFPGLTSAPKLQPIQTRLVMLSTGMRARIGVKVYGPDLKTIEKVGFELEKILKEVPGVNPTTVFADRVVGKPYLEIKLKRQDMSRYGLTVNDLQKQLMVAVGGKPLTTTVEGRERYSVRVRYARELRDNPDDLKKILISTPSGINIPLEEVADIQYVRGPQMIKSEDTFLTSYVIFDKTDGYAEVDVVENAQKIIKDKIDKGEFQLPAGVTYKFTGNYENQIRATKRLAIVIPISLIVIFLILFFQFKTITASSIHFSGVFVAFAGGFIFLWLYSQPWFLNFEIDGVNMRHLFQIHPINMSVAVWVGFIALFGIATDDGVIMGTYIHETFEERNPKTIKAVREAVIEAGSKRVRPAMMTAAVAIIALLPVLSSTGKGSDIMVPMAIPTFGGMTIQIMTMFIVPILQCFWREGVIKKQEKLKS